MCIFSLSSTSINYNINKSSKINLLIIIYFSVQKLGGEKSELPKPIFAPDTTKPAANQSSGFSFGATLNLSKPSEPKSEGNLFAHQFGATTITPVMNPAPASVEEMSKEESKPSISFFVVGSGNSTTPSTTSLFSGFGEKQEKAPSEVNQEKPLELPKSPLASLVETVNRVDFASAPTTIVEKPTEFSLVKEIGSADKEKSPEKGQIIKPTAQFSFGFNEQSDSGANNANASTNAPPKSIFGGFATPTATQANVQNDETTPTNYSLPSTKSDSTDEKSPDEFNFSTAAMSLAQTPESVETNTSNVSPTAGSGFG